jgi:hypothetical protein
MYVRRSGVYGGNLIIAVSEVYKVPVYSESDGQIISLLMTIIVYHFGG